MTTTPPLPPVNSSIHLDEHVPIHNMSDIRSLIQDNFDGDRSKLYDFLQDCGQAWSLCVGSQKTLLISYIESKLKGSARAQTRFKRFYDFDDIKECLIELFGDRRDLSQILEELNTLRQGKMESVQSYFSRIELLQTLALNTTSLQDEDESMGRIAMIKEIALQRFILHSNEDISSCLRRSKPKNINAALSEALLEEKHLLARKQNLPKTYNSFENSYCSNCKKKGHTLRECYSKNRNYNSYNSNSLRPSDSRTSFNSQASRNFSNSNNSRNFPNSNNSQHFSNSNNSRNFNSINYNNRLQNQNNSHQPKFCNYCKRQGHLINECRKREYNNRVRSSNNSPPQNSHVNLVDRSSNPNSNSLNWEQSTASVALMD